MTPEERYQKFQEELKVLNQKYGITQLADAQIEKVQGELTGTSYSLKPVIVGVIDPEWSISALPPEGDES